MPSIDEPATRRDLMWRLVRKAYNVLAPRQDYASAFLRDMERTVRSPQSTFTDRQLVYAAFLAMTPEAGDLSLDENGVLPPLDGETSLHPASRASRWNL